MLGLILLCFAFFCLGYLVRVVVVAIKRSYEIPETRELIIESVCQHAYVEDSRSEGDYDINVGRKGWDEIDKILEGLS